jgi:hypothetical protein
MQIKTINQTDKNKCNCVLYVKAHTKYPFWGSWTLTDKKRTINTQKASIGSVAIMNVGVWYKRLGFNVFSGHVGIVIKIRGSQITIREANYLSCKITERTGTRNELKILGYYAPKKLNPRTLIGALNAYIRRYIERYGKRPTKALIEKMRQLLKKQY